jgi:regulator of RNase E activity RraA
MVGPALTVKVPAGDNLFLHKALDMAQEGDVIILSNKGGNTQAIMGEIMVTYGRSKKIAGIVLDGPIRDIDAISKMDFPLFATGSTPGGPYKEGPGEVNTPIAIGDVTVCPGDIILADADGVIVIPRQDAAGLLEKAKEYSKFDASKLEEAKNGTSKRGWVAEALAKKNVEIIDDVFRY